MASLTDAFRIIAQELPKFFTETGTPFLGKDQEQSVMKEKDSIQKEKDVNEALLKLGAAAPAALLGGVKALQIAKEFPKLASSLVSGGTFAATGDPLDLVPGKLGKVIGSTGEAEAMVVPAHKTKSFEEISRAVSMIARGVNPEVAYKSTGIYKGPKDNILRSVISDEGASLKEIDKAATLGDLIEHPKLFAAMPELKNIKISKVPQETLDAATKRGSTILGGYDPAGNTLQLNFNRRTDELISTILHETQHAVQSGNNMVGGGNVARAMRHPETERVWNQISPTLPKNLPEDEFDSLLNRISREVYMRGAGEAEARATQKMFEEKKFTDLPTKHYDVDINSLLFPDK